MPDKERKKLLNELCKMCGRKGVIPSSMHIPDCSNGAAEIEYQGGFASVSRSKYGGYQVAIKTVNTNTKTLKDDRSVSVPLLSPSHSHVRMHHRDFAERWWPGSTFGIQTFCRCLE